MTLQNDPVVEEVRQTRRAYARQFGFDLRAMAADLRKKQEQHYDRLVSFSPRPARRRKTV
jgi:hypothetical protein